MYMYLYLFCRTVPVTKTYYKDRKSGKEFLAYNLFMQKAKSGSDEPQNMEDYLLTELDELWLVNLIVNICQVVVWYSYFCIAYT